MSKLKQKFVVEIYAIDSKQGWLLLDWDFDTEKSAIDKAISVYPDTTFKVTRVFKALSFS